MRRWPVALIALCAGVPIVLATRVLAHDREAAVQELAQEKLAGLSEAALDLGGNPSRVGSARVLVLSAHGVPAPGSDPSLMRLDNAVIAKLVAGARDRVSSTARIDADAAAALGLPRAEAVVVAVPVPIDGGAPWVLAL